uniref:Uncharacterized protein n=1 Tax=Anguilla anguilla TaxID=7936 RepID=A0A0E9VAM5_ANGAN
MYKLRSLCVVSFYCLLLIECEAI